MTTQQAQKEMELLAAKFEAEVREADATLKTLEAQAKARKAKEDMDEISGLTAAKERASKNIADLKQKVAADRATAKQEVEKSIKELQVGIERVSERYSAWDAARERRLYAELDEADAKLAAWKARYDKDTVRDKVQIHNDLAKLEEKIALARARAAENRLERHSAKAEKALVDAARNFDDAYNAAAKRYDTV